MRSEQRSGAKRAGEVMLVVAASAPSLVFQLFFSYLKAKRRAKAAGKEFYKAMVTSGMPRKEARSLAEAYSSSLSIRKIMRGYGLPGMLGRLSKQS